jgi:hypothetical protein
MATELPKNRFLDATGVKKLWDLLTGKIPATLPNPASLTIQNSGGTTQVTYDGSEEKSLKLTKSMVGLSNVENTKLSTWAGTAKLTTCSKGTFGSIVTKSDTDYMAAGDTSHATHVTSDAQTWTGVKTFDDGLVSNSDITVTGKVNASGGFFETSDERLKNIEKPLNIDFENLAKLQKIYFTFKSNPDKLEIGVLAQEIQSIYPELVSSKEDGTLTVDYAKLSVIALSAVDELYKQNKEFDERLTKIEKILNC